MIKVSNLHRIYTLGDTEVRAVDGISFEINEGEFISITGRSGSGKSTLLHQMGLLDYPTSGQIYVNGIDISTLNREKRTKFRLKNLGYVFQDYALIPTLTAHENVYLPLMMQGYRNSKAKNIACESLRMVGLEERFKNLPSQLSGGEQQRVSIARSIVNNPKILFADEPTANLDSETAQVVLDVLQQLNDNGQTLVMVTHEPEFSSMGDRIFNLSDGKLVDIEVINNK